MVRSRAATVDEYLAELPGERRAVIARLRELTRSHLGGFQEGMEYGMPYYRGPKDRTFAFASQEGYVALYVGDRGAELARREKLDVGKACIRLRQLDTIDWDLVERIVRASGP